MKKTAPILGVILLTIIFFSLSWAEPPPKLRININTATQEVLELLPYIGKVRAREIVNYRTKHGEFKKVEDVAGVPGIGKETLASIRQYLILSGSSEFNPEPKIIDLDEDIRDFVLLENRSFYTRLGKELDRAQIEIVVAMFLFKTSKHPSNWANIILRKLVKAAQRGVKVRLFLERDSDPSSSLNRENLATAERLKAAGIEINFDSPKKTTHTKLIVIDQRLTFIGSHNITHSALKYNNEASILVDSPDLSKKVLDYLDTIREQ
ncbi:MAG: helix-hairpin-helix domain-containing protein [Deltaproteobacteria bacterium]|nr:MAG: helix-hairpin-helix domain-containing protein [Deltaproteobacteria bacterium]